MGSWPPTGTGGGGIADWGLVSEVHFVSAGNPNGVITSVAKGDVCLDTSTPALWQATAATATTWTQVGAAATLTSTHLFVGNGSNVATDVAASGDLTLANTGAFTIAAAAVTLAKMANLAANSIVGNNTGSPATPIALTRAQVMALLSANAGADFSMNSHKITALADGSAVTDAATINNINTVPINNQTGTTYTTVLADAGALITLSNSGSIALTIDSNANVAFPIGTQIQILQLGAGQVTVGITADTLHGTPGLKTRAQYSQATLTKILVTTWVASGDLSA